MRDAAIIIAGIVGVVSTYLLGYNMGAQCMVDRVRMYFSVSGSYNPSMGDALARFMMKDRL
jgi:hypothetical protein